MFVNKVKCDEIVIVVLMKGFLLNSVWKWIMGCVVCWFVMIKFIIKNIVIKSIGYIYNEW